MDYARRVGLDFVHFMQSYPTQGGRGLWGAGRMGAGWQLGQPTGSLACVRLVPRLRMLIGGPVCCTHVWYNPGAARIEHRRCLQHHRLLHLISCARGALPPSLHAGARHCAPGPSRQRGCVACGLVCGPAAWQPWVAAAGCHVGPPAALAAMWGPPSMSLAAGRRARAPSPSMCSGEVMLVPANVMNLWLAKFEAKFKRDPDFLTRQVGGRAGWVVGRVGQGVRRRFLRRMQVAGATASLCAAGCPCMLHMCILARHPARACSLHDYVWRTPRPPCKLNHTSHCSPTEGAAITHTVVEGGTLEAPNDWIQHEARAGRAGCCLRLARGATAPCAPTKRKIRGKAISLPWREVEPFARGVVARSAQITGKTPKKQPSSLRVGVGLPCFIGRFAKKGASVHF